MENKSVKNKFRKYKMNEMPIYSDIIYSNDYPDQSIPGKRGTIWFAKDGRVFTWYWTETQDEGWFEFNKKDARFLKYRLYNRIEDWYIDWKLFDHSKHHIYLKLDEKAIGTSKYQGHAYFWNYDYRHYLRDRDKRTLIKVHDALLKEGLILHEASDKHEEIILKIIKNLSCKISGTPNKQYKKRKLKDN
jgi:hypothetical protein